MGISSVGIIKAISFAEANNADIINISIGSAEPINLKDTPPG